jgi:hypothetical protein
MRVCNIRETVAAQASGLVISAPTMFLMVLEYNLWFFAATLFTIRGVVFSPRCELRLPAGASQSY